ncbi:MAG: beta-lactamase family protein [Methanobacteriota archaeon]|nr:MAG: beta-lactamase family protein [Euryarchaeota archaeon]
MADLKQAFESLDDYYTRRMAADNIPGMGVAVTDRDRTLRSSAMGVADVSTGAKVTPDTLFQIGSIGKSFTSIALLQLKEQGKLDLHAPVKEFLPWFEIRSKYAPITLHHLLTHTAGIPIGSESTLAPESEVWYLREIEASAPPGDFFHYSNTGYKALGLVLEAVTGSPCAEEVTKRVVEPLGMTQTFAAITNDLRPSTAIGYGWLHDDRPAGRKSALAPAVWSESTSADGSISSVPEDMAAYIRMLLRRGQGPEGRLISEDSFELLTGRYIVPHDSYHGESYGYGLNIEDNSGHLYIWHTGGMVGFTSSLLLDMDLGVGMIALTNSLAGPDEIVRHAMQTVRAAIEGKELPEAGIPPHAYVPISPGQFAGTYKGSSRTVDISVDGGLLIAEIEGERYVLEGVKEDYFLLDHLSFLPYAIKFTREGDRVTGFACGPEVYTLEPFERRPPRTQAPEEWSGFVGHYRSHNPWQPNIRIVLREGQLVLIDPMGGEEAMHPQPDGSFRIGATPRSPELILFDMVIGGKAFRACLSGGFLYRSFVP